MRKKREKVYLNFGNKNKERIKRGLINPNFKNQNLNFEEEEINIIDKRRKMDNIIKIEALVLKESRDILGMTRGLTFRRKEKAEAMLFEFNQNVKMVIHSLFVFFSFIGIWLDDKNEIIKIEKVKPFRFIIKSPKKYRRLIEIPLNNRYNDLAFLVEGKV